jgi:hypothetical protein
MTQCRFILENLSVVSVTVRVLSYMKEPMDDYDEADKS